MGQVFAPDGKTLYVTLGRRKAVVAIDVATRKPQRVFEDVGPRPWGIAISPDGKTLYTANGGSGDVSFLDIASGKVEKRVKVGGSPWGVVVIAK
jgi:YVTN family beta-propeller protein